MYVDYRDLNKACLKDNFPFPHIDTLVDSAALSAMYSFMDGFFGYNQIKMVEADKLKTLFITDHDMIHKEIKVYVDDMMVKSPTREGHFEALDKFLDRVKKYNLRPNPKKCVFGVTSGKLLGHIVNRRGIEVNPDKVKAISEMPAPRIEK